MGFVINDAAPAVDVDAAAVAAAVAAHGDAVTVRGALQGQEVDDLSGTGWTTTAPVGGASATWATGPARLVLSVPAATQGAVGVERAALLPSGADEWDVLVRTVVTAGDASSMTRVQVCVGQSATHCAVAQFWTNGTLELGREVSTDTPSYTGLTYGAATGLDAGVRTGGQLWVRFSKRVGRLLVSWGIGSSGEVPAVWRTPRQSDDEAAVAAACGTYVKVAVAVTDTSVAGGLGVEVRAIRAVGQGAGPL